MQLGLGLATYVEVTGGGSGEFGAVDIDADGVVTLRVGTSAHGQGHATTFAMVVADKLGVPMERVRFVQSDTAAVPRGQGTGGSRSLQLGGSALGAAADLVVDQARDLAARLLEAPASDVELADDGFQVVGVPTATVSWLEIAKLAADEETRLGADHDFKAEGATFPFGAHLAVVEVDTAPSAWSPWTTADASSTRSSSLGSSTGAPRKGSRRHCGRGSSTTRTASR